MAGQTSRTVQVNIVGDSSKLQGAMSKAGESAEGAGKRIMSAWRSVGSQLSSAFGGALEPILSTLDGVGAAVDHLSEKGKTLGGVMLGVGAAGAVAGTALNVFGSKDKAAEQQLGQAFKNVGANVDDYKGRIDETVKSMAKYGYTNDQVHDALTSLVTATKDPTKAIDLMGEAANLAAFKHISLASAADQLVKVVGGKGTRVMAELGIQTKGAGKATLDANDALRLISERINGQASAAADTFTGKMQATRAEIENQVSALGQKYGPAIQGASAGMALLGGATETVSGLIGKFKAADELSSAAEGIKTTAEAADTAAEGAEAAGATVADAATLPLIATVGLIVAAVALLGIGVYELVTHWRQAFGFVKQITADAWHAIDADFIQPIERFFTGVADFVKAHWQLILAVLTGPIGLAALFISHHVDAIVGFFTAIPGRIASTAEHMWDGMKNAFKTAVDFVIGLWNDIAGATEFTLPKINVGPIHIGGEHVGPLLPKLPMFAGGGIVTGPMLAGLGDNASGTEAIVPLERAGEFGFGGGGDIVVPVTLEIDGLAFARATHRYTRDQLIRSGRNTSKGKLI